MMLYTTQSVGNWGNAHEGVGDGAAELVVAHVQPPQVRRCGKLRRNCAHQLPASRQQFS